MSQKVIGTFAWPGTLNFLTTFSGGRNHEPRRDEHSSDTSLNGIFILRILNKELFEPFIELKNQRNIAN